MKKALSIAFGIALILGSLVYSQVAEGAREGGLYNQFSAMSPVNYRVSIATGSYEFSQALPAGTKKVVIQNSTTQDTYIAWATGKVATPTGAYFTVKSGTVLTLDDLYFSSATTLYFGSTPSGCYVEIQAFQ